MEQSIDIKLLDVCMSIAKSNKKEMVEEAFNLLLKLFNNISKNPGESKIRNFKISNETLKTKVLFIKNILQVIEIIGYKITSEENYSFEHENITSINLGIKILSNVLNELEYLKNESANKVTLLLYDISNGMARSYSPMLIGKTIEAVWHSSLLVYGK